MSAGFLANEGAEMTCENCGKELTLLCEAIVHTVTFLTVCSISRPYSGGNIAVIRPERG
jgi:hypothetical protein